MSIEAGVVGLKENKPIYQILRICTLFSYFLIDFFTLRRRCLVEQRTFLLRRPFRRVVIVALI